MRRLRIGRSDTNEIVIADASVSRQHAELVELGGGRFSLKDLGSTFGTHVWQNQAWVPAAETEIRADTVIRFGEFRTTLFDVVSAVERAALGLTPPPAPMPTPLVEKTPAAPPAAAPPPPAPAPAAPPPADSASAAPAPAVPPPAAPSPAKASPAPAPPAAAPPAATPPSPKPAAAPRTQQSPPAAATPPPPRVSARPRRTTTDRQRNAMRLGLIGVGSIFVVAIVAVIVIFAFGDANPAPRPNDRPVAGDGGQQKFFAACTKDWNVDERRCRCFLAAAGPNLQPDDYDDFTDVVDAYLSGDSDRTESSLQRVNEKRGAHASSRISTAFKGVVRDCQ